MSEKAQPEYEIVVVAFDDETKAEQVLSSLKDLETMDIVDLKSGAVIVRSAEGDVTINETRDFDAKQGAIGGAIAGGLIGLLRGGLLKGALLGAAGGAAAGKFVDLGLDDEFLQTVSENLGPGSSAIVVTIDFTKVEPAMAELGKFEGGRILRHSLSEDVYQKLADAIED